MKLKCPACGTPVTAGDINIQQMVAVCPHCDNIFKFDRVFADQPRKIKAPVQFRIVDDDPSQLDIAFKWSWRTEPPMAMVSIVLVFVGTLATFVGMMTEGAPFEAALMPLLPLLWVLYLLLTLWLNRTHYVSDGETLRVYTEPLPYLRYGSKTIAVEDIRDVTVERPAYAPFPEGKAGFYNVYAHTLDGDKIQIAAYVNYEHAHFIAQEVTAHLQTLREAPEYSALQLEQNEPESYADWGSAEPKRLKQ